MKAIKFYLFVLAALALAACTDDHLERVNPTDDGDRKITFVFPGVAKGSTTYATEGSADENKIETLDIYVFTEHPNSAENPKPMVLEEVLQNGDPQKGYFELTNSGDDKVATITVPAGNKKHFFFIANGRTFYNPQKFRLLETTVTDFTKVNNGMSNSHIICPLQMTADVLVDDIEQNNITSLDVTLTRRMARFDIKNDSEDSGFIIDEILINNACGSVTVFASSTPLASATLHNLPPIDFSIYPDANHGVSSSVFYLYPTIAAYMADPDKVLNFQLVGRSTTNGTPQVYPVKVQKPDGSDLSIDANHLYTIHILNMGIGYINATLMVDDWTHDPDNDVNNPAAYGTIKLKDSNGNAIPGNNTYYINSDDIAPHNILVEADTEWDIYIDPKYYYWVELSPLTSGKVNKDFTIRATSINPGTSTRQAVISVFNKKRPSIYQTLVLTQRPSVTADRYLQLLTSAYVTTHNTNYRINIPGEMTKQFAVSVDVPADTAWIVTKDPAADWFDMKYSTDPSNPIGPAQLLITPTKMNMSSDVRTTTITFETVPTGDPNDKLVLKVPLNQAVANLGSIRLEGAGLGSNGEMSVGKDGFGGKRQIWVYAHTDWEVAALDDNTPSAPVTWVTISEETKKAGEFNGSFKISVDPNTGAERVANIVVKNKLNENIKKTIKLTQADGTPTP